MKKYVFVAAVPAFILFGSAGCSDNAPGKGVAPADSAVVTHSRKDSVGPGQRAVVYTCKMHPEVISDKPGKCPICGMDLVKKTEPHGQ